ncbi:MAG: hypothetical protein IKQ87_02170, partial [Clostridia bacterium]|nr:hypothetical protein [Clostridia bacterium]
ASGNLYRMLEYYDSETGVLDVTDLAENTKIFGTACSGTTGWGWARVVNSATCAWTAGLNTHYGLLRVGPYSYDDAMVRYGENGFPDAKPIARQNGETKMFASYALMDVADCIVNNGHVRMIAEKPEVVRKADGSIDGEKSRVMIVEQGLYTTGEDHQRVSADRIPYEIQGCDGRYYTFRDLYDTGYLPHTFKEFLGQDPVEPGEAKLSVTGEDLAVEALWGSTLTANYVVSDVFTTVRDASGKVLRREVYRATNHFTRTVKMIDAFSSGTMRGYREPGNTIEISAQLGNGELVVAYSGKIA